MDKNGKDPLPQDKLEILRECASKAYQSTSEIVAAIDDDYMKGILTKEQRQQAIGELDTYDAYATFM
jgi:hypothetical protein